MRRKIWLALGLGAAAWAVLLGVLAQPATAGEADMYCATSTTSTGAIIWTPCGPAGGGSITTTPPKITAYGILSVSTSSVALSTLTTSPNSAAWSTTYPNGYVAIRNSILSAGVVYVCWLGGTCSAAVGDPIAVGQSATRNVGNGVSPTVFAASTASITGWE